MGIGFSVVPARAQMSDEEKKRLFLQAREDIRPVPKSSATPRPKPQPAGTPRPTPKATAKPAPTATSESAQKPRATPEAVPEATPEATPEPTAKPIPRETPPPETPEPTPVPKETPEPKAPPASKETPKEKPKETPKATPKPEARPSSTPVPGKPAPTPREAQPTTDSAGDFILLPGEKPGSPREKPLPSASPAPSPEESPQPAPVQIPKGKTPGGERLDAPIHVEKSGLEKDLGEEPAPKKQFGGFFKRYRYLTPSVRKAIDGARVQRGRWKYIIIHNSGTRQGNARIFDVYHRRTRKMQNGLAYHFVIGNGNSSGNGQIEIGSRWTRQINGGHVASDYLNNIALGICLVGDLNRDKPTPEQLAAIDELVTYLRGRVGKIKGKQAIVKGHKEINPKPTDCPGDRFPLGWLRQKFR